MENLEATKRISKWCSELRSYILKYELRTTIKGQVLADFIADFTVGTTKYADQLEGWVNVDGESNSKGAGIEIVLTTLEGSIIGQSFNLDFPHLTTKQNMKLSWLGFERLLPSKLYGSKFAVTPCW